MYKDLNRINNQILHEIQKKVMEIYEIEVKRKKEIGPIDAGIR